MTLTYEDIAEIFPLEEVKLQLRIQGDDEDSLLEQKIVAAVEAIEDETGHLFTAREVTEAFSAFGSARLKSWPINAVTGIAYYDPQGAAQTFDPTLLRVSTIARPARLVRVSSPLPYTSGEADAVAVTMNAGYADPDDIPARLREAVLVMVSDLFSQRESFVAGVSTAKVPLSLTVERMVQSFTLSAV